MSDLNNLLWNHPDVAAAWATLIAALSTLAIGIPTLLYLIKYTRRTEELRIEAGKQTAIQSDSYEASVMPLLVAEFGEQIFGRIRCPAVLLKNIGRGPALGVEFCPVCDASGITNFDYIPVIGCGESQPLICARVEKAPDAPREQGSEQAAIERSQLCQSARDAVLRYSGTDELKVMTRSLSNTEHEFFFKLELRGSDRHAILAYQGRNSRPGKAHGPRQVSLSGRSAGSSAVST